jgi:lysophospholipase L1-like esterase
VSALDVQGARTFGRRGLDGLRFAALGDSITAGYGDPVPGGWRGWAQLLAEGLAPRVSFYKLAVSGALTADVVGEQLPAALRLQPDVASVIVGVNDTLRGSFDADAIGRALTETVVQLRAIGAIVLTARLPDPGRMLGLPELLARPLARRVRAVNAITDVVAAQYGTVHFDAAGHPDTYDRRMWSIDRLHPSERGHRLLAAGFGRMLAGAGVPVWCQPSPHPTNPEPSRAAQLWWMATRGSRWVLDRSTDLVPYLLRMAAAEWWSQMRGSDSTDSFRAMEWVVAPVASPPEGVHGELEDAGTART